MRQFPYIIILASTLFTAIFWFIHIKEEAVESITYFPIDPNSTYIEANTKISDPVSSENEVYQFEVKTQSKLNKSAYLRQDISLLFANGRLVGKMGKWEEQTDTIVNEHLFILANNRLLKAVTFHHSEIHYDEQITSVQSMSSDFLYVTHTYPALKSFKTPASEDDVGWVEVLEKQENEIIDANLRSARQNYQINLENYFIIPLTDLPDYNNKPLPAYSQAESKKIIGQLWEGLYKNYFLGIKKKDGTQISALNSTIPTILISKNENHLYVIFESSNSESILLYQKISK